MAEHLNETTVSEGRKVWSAYSSLPAVRANRIHVVNGDDLVRPGPDAGRSARRLFDIIHGEG